VAEALDLERPALQPMLGPFDGFHETAHAVTGTCLISFDRNRYSVMAKAARRAVQVGVYADRIVVRLCDEVVAEHARHFGRDRAVYDPWHYLPVLTTKPGALRNGAPFQDWDLPPALARLRRKLGSGDEADPALRAGAGSCADRWSGRGRGRDPRSARCRRRQRRSQAQPSATRGLRPLRHGARPQCSGMR